MAQAGSHLAVIVAQEVECGQEEAGEEQHGGQVDHGGLILGLQCERKGGMGSGGEAWRV